MPTTLTYPGVYVEEIPSGVHTIEGVATSTAAFIGRTSMGPVNVPVPIQSFAEYTRVFGGLWSKSSLSFAVLDFFINGGQQAVVVRVYHGTKKMAGSGAAGRTLTKTQILKGLKALDQCDLFNLLCIPPYRTAGFVDKSVISAAAAYCERRRTFFIIDSPSSWTDVGKAKTGFSAGIGTTSANAALYFPRIKQPNPLKQGQIEIFASCGAVAGIFARTDANRGVWKAPAGTGASIAGVDGLSVALNNAQNGELNPLAINCLRTFPAAGTVVWGSRTLQGADGLASEWKYIPIRRTALFIEESLYRGTQWAVFEPNDEPLWAQIRLNVGAFMNNLFRQGAFQRSTPRDAYFVKCDSETTTQNDINLGIVNIVVGFAPLKPAEFVVITIQQIAGQTEQ